MKKEEGRRKKEDRWETKISITAIEYSRPPLWHGLFVPFSVAPQAAAPLAAARDLQCHRNLQNHSLALPLVFKTPTAVVVQMYNHAAYTGVLPY